MHPSLGRVGVCPWDDCPARAARRNLCQEQRLRTPRPATEPRHGPTRNFHKKYRKNTPRAKILEPQQNTEKIPKKYPKCEFWVFLGYFSVFSGYFGCKFRESRISGRGVFFRYFSWKFRVGPFRGSVAGRGVLKTKKRGFSKLCLCRIQCHAQNNQKPTKDCGPDLALRAPQVREAYSITETLGKLQAWEIDRKGKIPKSA